MSNLQTLLALRKHGRKLSMSLHPGARGLLAEEEERLFKLRQEIEGEARQELDRARLELEEEGRASMSGKLCATPFGVDVVGITEFIALTGALVGGTHPFSTRHPGTKSLNCCFPAPEMSIAVRLPECS